MDEPYGPPQPQPPNPHSRYCQEDWAMYLGNGPRGMGPNNDGCVCSLEPEGYYDDPA